MAAGVALAGAAGAPTVAPEVGSAVRAVPQVPQNFSPGSNGAPHEGQPTARLAPHSTQNRRPGLFSVAQFEQFTVGGG